MEKESTINSLLVRSEFPMAEFATAQDSVCSSIKKVQKAQSKIGRFADRIVERFLGLSISAFEPQNQILFDDSDLIVHGAD